jgi:hypothetical protein
VPVSTTTRPVTQTAEVDVNNAFKKPTLCLSCVATGSVSKHPPKSIIPRNPSANICTGCILRKFLIALFNEFSS